MVVVEGRNRDVTDFWYLKRRRFRVTSQILCHIRMDGDLPYTIEHELQEEKTRKYVTFHSGKR